MERLSDAEAAWTEDDLKDWLQLAEVILRTVYVGGQADAMKGV